MTMAPESWVWLARIRRPQGRKGEVFAELLTDFPERFAERRRLWLIRAGAGAPGPSPLGTGETIDQPLTGPLHSGTLENRPVHQHSRQVDLISHWLHKGGIVLHFAGVDSISAAEALAGLIVAIPRAERAALPADEAYIGDLIGCTLLNVSNVDVAGTNPVSVGEIEDVNLSAGPVPLLIVRSPSGEVLIPFAKDYLRRIDLAARRVEMALPEGLVDLNNVPDKAKE
jgi:16S rRNA processing protein RimM